MENQLAEEQTQKKGRHRKKQLYNSIMQQMEFYFSDSNLSKDKFLLPMIQSDPYVDIEIFLKFNKIRKLTTNTDDIIKAINNSQLLELSEDKTKVQRKTLFNVKENVDNCTLYVERIKIDATHEWLSSVFSDFGNITYVSIPKYSHNKVNKGFAFIEFEKESEATEALNYFESIGCKMSTLMPPENLCSIVTYDGTKANELTAEDYEEKEPCDDNTEKKRKRSSEEFDNLRKKIKSDNATGDTDNSEYVPTDDIEEEERKKRKHKKMKKKIFKELGLQVLSKFEWKKIRNRYLNNQKAKMKQLKQFLHKKKINYHTSDAKHKVDHQNKNVDHQSKIVDQENFVEKLTYTPGVIVKTQLSEPYRELKKIKEELQLYSTDIQYVDIPPINGGSEAYLRFSDGDGAEKFCSSSYKGQSLILEGKEEEEYWIKINNSRSLKFKKNQKRLRGRDKLLKKAEKELGKHIKFDDTD